MALQKPSDLFNKKERVSSIDTSIQDLADKPELNTFSDAFDSFKNNLTSHCTKEWIFNIDADELPSGFLLENLNDILESNSDLDLLIVPRWNIVDGITDDHVKIGRAHV